MTYQTGWPAAFWARFRERLFFLLLHQHQVKEKKKENLTDECDPPVFISQFPFVTEGMHGSTRTSASSGNLKRKRHLETCVSVISSVLIRTQGKGGDGVETASGGSPGTASRPRRVSGQGWPRPTRLLTPDTHCRLQNNHLLFWRGRGKKKKKKVILTWSFNKQALIWPLSPNFLLSSRPTHH